MFYVLQVYNTFELGVKKNIELKIEQGLLPEIKEVLVPYQDYISISEKGNRSQLKKAIYPGYVYVDIENYSPRVWQILKEIPKISKFIGDKNHPVAMSPKEIQKIRDADKIRINDTEIKYNVKFKIGDKVLISDGPFTNLKGTITDHNPETKEVNVDVLIFGRVTPVKIFERSISVIAD